MEEKEKQQVVLNRYEAVLVASKLARKINGLRLAAKEQLAPEELIDIDRRKVTTVALDELNGGKVKYERKVKIEEESTYDLT
ncbi:MAG: DNA-directed RNA polymerase subunit omega [candidate division Zixibacteria bacterium]